MSNAKSRRGRKRSPAETASEVAAAFQRKVIELQANPSPSSDSVDPALVGDLVIASRILAQHGVTTRLISVDKTLAPYQTLKRLLHAGRVIYGQSVWQGEYCNLKMHSAKKVDHPPGKSKDGSDAVAGAVYSCWMSTVALLAGRKPDAEDEERVTRMKRRRGQQDAERQERHSRREEQRSTERRGNRREP